MDYPDYVPVAVRKHISLLIEGDQSDPFGWAALLVSAKEELAQVDRSIRAQTGGGETEYLQRKRAEAAKHHDRVAANVACLRRLARDKRMRDVYSILVREFSTGEQSRDFIRASWAARMEYGQYRDRLKRATELRDEIADTSRKLAQLLRDASITTPYWPLEFSSIPALLQRTDNHEMQGHNLAMWKRLRRHVVGVLPPQEIDEKAQERPQSETKVRIRRKFLAPGEKVETNPEQQARAALLYAWGCAPPLSALLETLSEAARDFTPSESGMVGSAIKARQRNTKTEYLRALGFLLTDVYHVPLTTAVMQAMALVANVVINLPNVDVSYDDVRKTLPMLNTETPKNLERK